MGQCHECDCKNVRRQHRQFQDHRQFQEFLSHLDSEYADVIYHTEVRWLSQGKVLEWSFTLRSEICLFFTEKQRPVKEISDPQWIFDLTFMTDITGHLID